LKAIITCCSTNNRYTDAVHYMGGSLPTDGLQWGTGSFNQLARPPDPAEVGPRWRDMWLECPFEEDEAVCRKSWDQRFRW
jgi:predicted acyl esterase